MTSPLRKAAVLLRSLPEREASDLLERLGPSASARLASVLNQGGGVLRQEQQMVLGELVRASQVARDSQPSRPRFDSGHKRDARQEHVQEEVSGPFAFLATLDRAELAITLADEHPQTIALVLAQLPAGPAAELLAELPEDLQVAVVRRAATLRPVAAGLLADVAAGLREKMGPAALAQWVSAGGPEWIAQVFHAGQRDQERKWFAALAHHNPEVAETIRQRLVTFEDLAALDASQFEPLIRGVSIRQWALALQGAPENLRDQVRGQLSSRAREILEEELRYLGTAPSREIATARQQIVELLRRLEDAGQIELRRAPPTIA